jgi:hypothetical protein
MVVIWLRYLCDNHPQLLSGRRFVAKCDNLPFVTCVNNRQSNHPQIAFLIGLIHHMSCNFGFDFRLEYIKSKDNVAADALSRGCVSDYVSHMLSAHNISADRLVEVPVDSTYRNWLSSRVIRLKL